MKETSPLNLYKQLPQTNCKKCGEETCMAFAAGLIARTRKVEDCTPLIEEKKYAKKLDTLKTIVAPELKMIYVGVGEKQVKIGGEDVMFRHQMTFFNKPPFAYDVTDAMEEAKLIERVKKITTWKKFYIGKWERVEMIAVRSVTDDPAKFAACVKKVMENSDFPLILCSFNPAVLKAGLDVAGKAKPLIYAATKDNWKEVAQLAFDFKVPVVLSVPFDLDGLKSMALTFASMGLTDLVLDPGTAPNGKMLQQTLQNFINLRRAAVEEAQRDIAYPVMALPINAWLTTDDPIRAAYWESVLTAAFTIRGGAVMIKHSTEAHSMMPDMHLRFNIYTDPRKPVQVKPGLYKVGNPGPESPVFVTTNFALTYYTVESDIASNAIDAYILAINTDGIGVQASVAGGQLNPTKIKDAMGETGFDWKGQKYPALVLPGMAAKFSGELEDLFAGQAKIMVGPEDSGRIVGWMKDMWPPK
ncbi:MAG: acetyl-CoA decarbonylase/synthase complex subunit gamma [Methanothrix sp.]|nr:acetyl-CoA decarbonylase/synthase complex subunit gamma [Methanothrix sp.]OPY43449.1 MAG: Acetyl-CoA decarbonylase/synthase complex subunit gamma 1 [Methanosaeta sp. PtaU1.Bin016]